MSDQIRLRLASVGDLDRIAELTVTAYVGEGLLAADDPYTEELADAAARLRDAELWVAEVGGEVVGAVTFCPPGSPYRELGGDGEGEFRMLAVDQRARGLGVARALVRRCIDRSEELGLGEIVLCSMPTMQPAHRLYAGLGFARDESLDWDVEPGLRLWGFRGPVPDSHHRVAPTEPGHPRALDLGPEGEPTTM